MTKTTALTPCEYGLHYCPNCDRDIREQTPQAAELVRQLAQWSKDKDAIESENARLRAALEEIGKLSTGWAWGREGIHLLTINSTTHKALARVVRSEITDTDRLNALELHVQTEGPLLLHCGIQNTGYTGLGFWDGFRDLRKALDGLVKAQRGNRES